ncbi:MAG: cysteine sulfinate desulfinase [Bdellovibrionales bacterium RIFOXYD12_FULL_39_22]|nr:MAG: cysteine sulfinate desulfinase [Bdellovibrionales bacterium RIFOXYB1_FULL_39_21]OFZ44344.1 MAG: cysteine sulfinate desulfinase [Bdellovibrionales bacterium RIFOXYC12_FULL_39_17]OFZ49199.1 MAG: cysteine sulfinate desulfinase [Bdellovibrionales bacterium RIFOXYC1_FULL_39_130]OFZ73764.1 MAG: cysteine sulfinate desulfinase [Bdellovibrionales bacterium RIFOXYC2_FULL_39_8]OFZ77007.1 MAG: cysteine sulfinate desulfinase [Bdellovibrionales bacterium RIFOXYD1_FULL_39_84]OFZ95220.1 MAG: cysteine 
MSTTSIKEYFPALNQKIRGKDFTYLDSAATTLKPRSVIEALTQYYTYDTANIHRGAHFLANKGTTAFEDTRDLVANFINAAHREEIIFTKGTTDSINLIAATFGERFINDGDEIILSTLEHHSNIIPWQLLSSRKKITIKYIPIDGNGDLILSEYRKLFTSKTKLVSITHVSNVLGTVNPIKELISFAHTQGVPILIDGAQSINHILIDVQELDCDFYAFSAHKMFGPNGVGVLYAKQTILEELPPYQGGGNMIDQVGEISSTYNKIPHKFEAGTPAIGEVIAFAEAIKFIKAIGQKQISKYDEDLLKYTITKLSPISGLKIIGNPAKRSGVVSFTLENVHSYDLGSILDMQGIAIRTGNHCAQQLMKCLNLTSIARASFTIYNTNSDIDRLADGIRKVKDFL